MAMPILLFHWGLTQPELVAITVFLIRLWIEAIDGLNELNLSLTANQLFNIREVKRAFPIISSGIQVADIISGFSIYLLLTLFGLQNVMLLAFGAMVIVPYCSITSAIATPTPFLTPPSINRR
jgi:hypothetical protein